MVYKDPGGPARDGNAFGEAFSILHALASFWTRQNQLPGTKRAWLKSLQEKFQTETRTMTTYIHPELDTRIEFISGGYILLEEGRIPHRGKEVLYYLGVGAVDASCCGRGGCAFLKIPGFVISWKKGVGPSGEAVSEIESVESEEDRQEIRKILLEKFPDYQQIEFL